MPAQLHSCNLKDATILWRYMSLGKFESMLENGGLYFARSDRLGDPYEGARSAADEDRYIHDDISKAVNLIANARIHQRITQMQAEGADIPRDPGELINSLFPSDDVLNPLYRLLADSRRLTPDALKDRLQQIKASLQRAGLPDLEDRLHKITGERLASMERLSRWNRTQMFVNCWHRNDYESDGMWNLYTDYRNTTDGVAIRTTLGDLRQLLDDQCTIGEVNYLDYQTDPIPRGGPYEDFLHKRRHFPHEQEVRALIWTHPVTRMKAGQYAQLNWDVPGPAQIWKTLPLDQLIGRIVLAPHSPPAFEERIRLLLEHHRLTILVERSAMEALPRFGM
jgi:hypothetical protein